MSLSTYRIVIGDAHRILLLAICYTAACQWLCCDCVDCIRSWIIHVIERSVIALGIDGNADKFM